MPLNIISNFAANRALSNLTFSSMDATKSVAKLSSGSRVVTAADDAAAMAIGSRLRTEVASLDQAIINTQQASSLLQIADGTLARIQDIMTRLKALSVQAGSQNLGDFERGLLDIEFQNMVAEIDRLSLEAEFNGKELFRHQNITGTNFSAAQGGFSIDTSALGTGGVINMAISNFQNFHPTLGGDGQYTFALQAADASAGGVWGNSADFSINLVGTNTMGGQIQFSTALDNALLVNPGLSNVALATGTTLRFDFGSATNTGVADETIENAGFVLSLNDTFNLSNVANAGITDNMTLTSVNPDANPNNLFQQGPTTDFTFKVGSGILPSEDQISVEFGGVSAINLGLGLGATRDREAASDLTALPGGLTTPSQGAHNLLSVSRADAASQAITFALDQVTRVRADVGSSMARLEVALKNVTSTLENTEAARSVLLDLDVAREMTNFTSKQILVQAGISVLAQANQLPQNLLRLFA